jgi:hypothetical protein
MRPFALAALLPILAGAAMAETPLQRALAPQSGPLYAYDMEFSSADLIANLRIDPSRPVGKRITVLTPAPTELDSDSLKKLGELEKRTEGKIFCSEFAENIPADATLVSETDDAATYDFTPVPGADDGEMARAFKYLKGRVTVSKSVPGILSFDMKAPGPFKPAVVAKVDAFDMHVTCTPSPDGRTRMEVMNFSVAGSAMMQDFDQRESRRISNLSPTRTPSAN